MRLEWVIIWILTIGNCVAMVRLHYWHKRVFDEYERVAELRRLLQQRYEQLGHD